jgi:hypothetical protein
MNHIHLPSPSAFTLPSPLEPTLGQDLFCKESKYLHSRQPGFILLEGQLVVKNIQEIFSQFFSAEVQMNNFINSTLGLGLFLVCSYMESIGH